MITLQILVVVLAIYFGARLGGIAIGYLGGAGVLILTFVLGLKPGHIPVDVLMIILSVIVAISTMQVAGGLDYMVDIAERIIRKNPKYIIYLGPIAGWSLTFLSGTGHTSYSLMPVITQVCKEQGIKPSYVLPISVVAAQMAITASPVSAAIIFLSGALEPFGFTFHSIVLSMIPITLGGSLLSSFVCSLFGNSKLDDKYTTHTSEHTKRVITKEAKLSVLIFMFFVILVVFYAAYISPALGLVKEVLISRDNAIYMFMLTASGFILWLCKVKPSKITECPIFRNGMVAVVCVFGVAWMSDTLIMNHIDSIKVFAGDILTKAPWVLVIILFFASMLLYSQAAAAKALIPTAILLGVAPISVMMAFVAVNALFILPTYPTLIAAVQIDDTGTTKVGKYIFNHSFLLPGFLSILFGFIIGYFLLPIIF